TGRMEDDWKPGTSEPIAFVAGVAPYRDEERVGLAIVFRAEPFWSLVRGWKAQLWNDEAGAERLVSTDAAALGHEIWFDLYEAIDSGQVDLERRPSAMT